MGNIRLSNGAEVAKVENWSSVLEMRSSQEVAIVVHDLRDAEEGRQAWSQTANAGAYREGGFPFPLEAGGILAKSLLKMAELVVVWCQDDIPR